MAAPPGVLSPRPPRSRQRPWAIPSENTTGSGRAAAGVVANFLRSGHAASGLCVLPRFEKACGPLGSQAKATGRNWLLQLKPRAIAATPITRISDKRPCRPSLCRRDSLPRDAPAGAGEPQLGLSGALVPHDQPQVEAVAVVEARAVATAASGASPFGLVEQPALGQLAGLVVVKAEVPVDAAGLVLGLPDEQADQDEDAHGKSNSDDPFHKGAGSRRGVTCHPAVACPPRPAGGRPHRPGLRLAATTAPDSLNS